MLGNFVIISDHSRAENKKQYIYDFAGLLSDEDYSKLSNLAKSLSVERETDFIILTTDKTGNLDVVQYMQNFYDEKGLGYDKRHGNTAILTIDMQNREVYLAGFYKAETYLDNERVELIRQKITPFLSAGQYYEASEQFIKLAHEYMGFKPGVNPENILFKGQFQVVLSLIIASLIVGIMMFRVGGRVTVTANTYIDNNTSRLIDKNDTYIRTTVTKVKKPSTNNNSSGGFGGGGGITGGGHSHSGSRGSF